MGDGLPANLNRLFARRPLSILNNGCWLRCTVLMVLPEPKMILLLNPLLSCAVETFGHILAAPQISVVDSLWIELYISLYMHTHIKQNCLLIIFECR